MDGENADVLNSCYSKLVRGRDAGILPEKWNTSELDTTTFSFYWEIIELLEALVKSRHEHKRVKGDKLAKYLFMTLAEELSDALASSAPLNFAKSKMLNNQNIQNEMNRKFVSEVDKRLSAVKYIVEQDPTSDQILAVCQKLDALIMEWIYEKKPDYYRNKAITVKSVEELYDSLTKVRMDRYVNRASGHSFVPYRAESRARPLIQFEGPANIIAALRETLADGSKQIEDAERTAKLVQAYEQFLLSHMDAAEKGSISASINGYLALSNYIQAKEVSEEKLEAAIRKDLINFVKDQFSDLQRLAYIPFPYSTFETSSLQAGFLKERIKNVQTQIMYAFYEPFRLLRIYYSVCNFTCVSNDAAKYMIQIFENSPPFQQLLLQMKQAILQLSMDNPQLPLPKSCAKFPVGAFFLDYFSRIPKDEFTQIYRETVVPVFSEEPEILESVLESLTTGTFAESILSEAVAVSSLLLWSCQIAILSSVNEWTRLLKDDYMNLLDFFGEIDKNS